MAKHEENPKASAKLVSGVFPPLEGPDGPPPPPPPVGTCQSLCGWGYFEWDGSDWLRPIDDMSYTHQEMWECLAGNDQRFDYYDEATGVAMQLFVSTVDKCANCPYMHPGEDHGREVAVCTHEDMEDPVVEPDSRPHPCPLPPASSFGISMGLQEYEQWIQPATPRDISEINDRGAADALPELLDLLDDDEHDDQPAGELLGLELLDDDDPSIQEGADEPQIDLPDEPIVQWPRLLVKTISKCSECPCMQNFDGIPICGHCDSPSTMLDNYYGAIPGFCPLSSVAGFIRNGAH